jgi:ATP-dependent DNA helicase PIF1
MMTPVLLDKLDAIGRGMRKAKGRPFGGLQVILVGDLYQLPPVNKEDDYSFVFESEFWRQNIKDYVILSTVHRQSDPVFLKVLEEARAGKLSQESIAILETRKSKEWKKLEIKPTLLFTRRADVEEINMAQLKKCEGPDVHFKAKTVYSPKLFAVKQSDQEIQLATDKMDKNGSYVPELVLRLGSQVMLLTNSPNLESEELEIELQTIESRPKPSDTTYIEWNKMKKELIIDIKCKKDKLSYGLVNGSRGVIHGFTKCDQHYPIVKFRNGDIRTLKNTTWASEEIEGFNREQIPLRLAYAVTIHKAQGATLDCALIDIGDNTFEYGQAYVALSRVKSLDSLYIWDLKASAFTVHPKVTQFFQSISDQTALKSAAMTEFNESTSEPLPE